MATNDCDESEAAGNGDTVKQSPLFQSHVNFQFWEFTAGSLFYSWSEGPTGWHSCQFLLSSSSIPVIPHQHFPILFFLAGSHSRDSSLLLPCRGHHSSKLQVSKTKCGLKLIHILSLSSSWDCGFSSVFCTTSRT